MQHLDRSFAVSLHLLHPTIDPDDITKALGLAPHRYQAAGPPRKAPFDQTSWMYQFDCAGDRDLVPILEVVASRLELHGEFLRSFVTVGGSMELFCGVHAVFNWDESFPSALLMRLSALSIDLRLDVYPATPPTQPYTNGR